MDSLKCHIDLIIIHRHYVIKIQFYVQQNLIFSWKKYKK